MLRKGGPAWTGMVARHAPESVAGMDRNTHIVVPKLDAERVLVFENVVKGWSARQQDEYWCLIISVERIHSREAVGE